MNAAKKLAYGVVLSFAVTLGATEARATASWETGPFVSSSWTANPSNMLRTATVSSSEMAQLADGRMVEFGSNGNVAPNDVVSWTLVDEATIYGVNVFSKYKDSGRDGIDISKLEVKTADSGDQWIDLGAPAVEYATIHLDGKNIAHDGISGTMYAKYADAGGEALATRVKAFRITFGPNQDNGKTGYGEVELVGVSSVGWKFNLTRPLTSLATISLNPAPDANGYYRDGTSVTMSLTPAEGVTFLRWDGDLPEELLANSTVTFTMAGVRTIKPYLSSATFVYQDGIICDGTQQYRVSESSDNITVSGVVELGEGNSAGLTKPIAGGKKITTIGSNAFASSGLASLVLPSSLERLESRAFVNCRSLTSVSPMFPDSLVYYGGGCFADAGEFTGNVRIGFGVDGAGAPKAVTFGIHDTVRGLQFQSQPLGPNIELGPGVTSIPAYTFRNCRSVTNLVISANMATIAANAFENLGQKVASVYFEGDKPTMADTAFTIVSDGVASRVRFCIPWRGGVGCPSWAAYTADTSKVTRWDSLTAEQQATYWTNFPRQSGDKWRPYGMTAAAAGGLPAGTWIVCLKNLPTVIYIH